MKGFIRGMGAISLFPADQKNATTLLPFKIQSDQEAFKNDLNAIASDMWGAIRIIKKEYPECK